MVDTEGKIRLISAHASRRPWVAVDTEADSLHAYPEKVCLIQISTAAGDRLVDPLAGFPLDSAPRRRFQGTNSSCTARITTSACCASIMSSFPARSFDTMLAARLLGAHQFSLSDLVEKYLGVKLEKGPQKANWALRPLTDRMEKYARNDTHYLKALSDHLKSELSEKGRLGWHAEYCARLIVESTSEPEPDPDQVWRIKGSHRLGRPALAVLRELWRWREQEATAANRPPFFVLSHELLVGLAEAAANGRSIEPLFPRHLSERRSSGIYSAVQKGLAIPPEHQPKIPRSSSRRPNEAQRRRYLEFQKRRDARATQLALDPTLLASRSVLSDLAHDWEKHSRELMNWQRAILEKPL